MQVFITQSAARRLQQLHDYYRKTASNSIANRIRGDVQKKVRSLSKMPFRGQEEPLLAHLGKGHRYIIEGHCKIIYRVEGDSVFVT